MSYSQVLAALEQQPTVIPGSPEEQAAIERFVDFVSVMSVETVRARVHQVYAGDAYFNDTLKEVRGAAAIEEYMAESLGATEEVAVEVTEVL